MKRIAFATGSRADYGIMRRYLHLLQQDEDIQLSILVTGALLSPLFGHAVDMIKEDGFPIDAAIEIPLDSSSDRAVLHTMAVALDRFAGHFSENRYDLLIVLGDRFEILAASIAAAMQKIPLLHIHGGEATYGNYDEFIRHAITKMSLYHFTSTEAYRRRVIQLGEAPDRVFNLGSLGAENCLYIDPALVDQCVRQLPNKGYFVVLFHPETLTGVDVGVQITELLRAVDQFQMLQFIFLGSNADTNSHLIRERIQVYVAAHNNCQYFENLHTDGYHYLLLHSLGLIGNSSSGIIEAPGLGIFTVNIGDRQKGRVRGRSVIDVACRASEIKRAMDSVLVNSQSISPQDSPYFSANTADRYYRVTKQILNRLSQDTKEPKIFYDIDVTAWKDHNKPAAHSL